MSAPPPPGWDDILDPGETILWQGAPVPGLRLSGGLGLSAFGFVFTAFSAFRIAMASGLGAGTGLIGAVFPLFGVPFLLVGLYMLVGRFFWAAHVRGATFHTLTDRRAYVATAILGKRALVACDIDGATPLELVEGPPDSIYFKARMDSSPSGRVALRVGLEYIDDGRRVYSLLRDVQKGAA